MRRVSHLLQCVAVCCSTLRYIAVRGSLVKSPSLEGASDASCLVRYSVRFSVFQCVAVCFSV